MYGLPSLTEAGFELTTEEYCLLLLCVSVHSVSCECQQCLCVLLSSVSSGVRFWEGWDMGVDNEDKICWRVNEGVSSPTLRLKVYMVHLGWSFRLVELSNRSVHSFRSRCHFGIKTEFK